MARERGRGRLGRFRRPVWRDGAFWAAVGLTALLFALQVALAGDRTSWLALLGLGVRLVVTWVVISSLIRIRVGMERGLVAGFEETDARAGPSGSTTAEGWARAGGRLAGKALSSWRDGPRKDRQRPGSGS
jgi:hypothetical protein